MSGKKDMRRTDLVIPYVQPKDEATADISSTFSSTMPMAAMFMRNRMIGWFSFVMSLLNWLGDSSSSSASGTPAYLSVGMSILALGVTYMPLFLPPPPNTARASSTGAAPPVPPS